MPKVKLFKAFFAPNNQLLKSGVHTVPDSWVLPKGTEVLEEERTEVLEEERIENEVPAKKPAAK